MNSSGLRATARKNGSEPLHHSGQPTGVSLIHFWQWSASNLLDNTLRGHFAEFLVATALAQNQGMRVQWDSADVITADGWRIEVKAAAYVQAWHAKPSRISFRIERKKNWNWEANAFGAVGRHSDFHVFCLLTEKDAQKVDPTNLDQWEFHVVATDWLDEKFQGQKTLSLAALKKSGVKAIPFASLESALAVLAQSRTKPVAASPP